MLHSHIYKDLPEHFLRLMRNWARGKAGLLSGLQPSKVYLLGVQTDGWGDAQIPCLLGDVANVDAALDAVPIRYRQVIMLFWQNEGVPLSRLARKRGIHRETMGIWIRQGHQLLRAEMARRHETLARVSEHNARTIGT